MGNRIITLSLLVLVMLIFVTYFMVQRRTFSSGIPVEGLFQGIIRDVEQREWPQAAQKMERLEERWEHGKFLIRLNHAETDYQLFEDAISRLAAAVQTKEIYEAISQAKVGRKLWINFIKIVPEP